MRPLALILPDGRPGLTLPLQRAMHDLVQRAVEPRVGMTSVPSALLPRLLDGPHGVVAWASPLVARELFALHLATPLLAVSSGVEVAATLVGRPSIESLADVAGRRVAWVSRLSATGYRIPRMYLESFGLDADHLFAQERFAGSHAAVGHALASGEVDVVATHSGRASDLAAVAHARVLASVGPLPAELIVTSPGVARESKLALTHTLMNARLGRFRFTLPRPRHLALFDLLRLDPGLAIPTPRESGVALVG